MKQKVKKYSKKEYQVVKYLFSGVSIESICKEQSFQKKTFSTHIGNVKNKFGLQSKQQIYYLFLIQKRLKLIEYT
ncbi:helix-turn-helix transcriptional regulator [Cedecea sp. MMO-103]|uniref:helix-turn-helix transcriptional regulator n=1 Tax=Cedecea sp. MMO-103 TaxID=3081238 RepID=UPI003FA5D7D7